MADDDDDDVTHLHLLIPDWKEKSLRVQPTPRKLAPNQFHQNRMLPKPGWENLTRFVRPIKRITCFWSRYPALHPQKPNKRSLRLDLPYLDGPNSIETHHAKLLIPPKLASLHLWPFNTHQELFDNTVFHKKKTDPHSPFIPNSFLWNAYQLWEPQ